MANRSITQLAVATTLTGLEVVPLVQNGVTKQATAQEIADLSSLTSGVNTVSFGSTGLQPSVATAGDIVVTGVVNSASGGTGVASPTGIMYFNGPAVATVATGAQVVATIGTTAVTNAVNAVNVTGGGTANFSTVTSGKYNGIGGGNF